MTTEGPLFINRELSWLAFNERVLEEAADPTTPLLERVKFAAIAAANLDEFFMVRVAAVKREIEDGDTAPDLAGLTPRRAALGDPTAVARLRRGALPPGQRGPAPRTGLARHPHRRAVGDRRCAPCRARHLLS